MLLNIASSLPWRTHVAQRFREATEAGLIAKDASCAEGAAELFVPDTLKASAHPELLPTTALRDLYVTSKSAVGGWIQRDDLFDEAAEWISSNSRSLGRIWLFSEAGYSELGDGVLVRRPHVTHGARPLLVADLVAASPDQIAHVLRWGRSQRILGVIQSEGPINGRFQPGGQMFFLCDGLDGDSLVVNRMV